MLGGNLGSLLYGDVSVMTITEFREKHYLFKYSGYMYMSVLLDFNVMR